MRDRPALRRIVLGAILALAGMAGATVASAGDRPRERFAPLQARVVVPAGGRATVGIRVQRPAGAFVRHRFSFARTFTLAVEPSVVEVPAARSATSGSP
jgi:hypothetical protein